ncbi:hypothetical protein SAMN05216548_13011 [Faunimonas pinastri]|uniref:Uncharacterized protein n=1 Tax=Faunimonas pinastri TaxID=1855383 RepID=A0A1H9QM15_9HYPH|nr:hypothetical protein [Faunimonas pinastri]SER61245.1 hypothetical protein SAMN05216548_13011 [Faunimonas pinastri]
MNTDLHAAVNALLRFVGTAIVIAAGLVLVFADVLILGDNLGEMSLTEIGQELTLFVISLLFWRSSRLPGHAGFGILVAGFFGCMLIRELDALFDHVFHGFWFFPAILLAAVCIFHAWRRRNEVLARLAEFARTPAFGTMMTGLIVILVFSRLFGITTLWHHMLAADYTKVAKKAVEEGSELLGYTICLASTLDYMFSLKRRARSTGTPRANLA